MAALEPESIELTYRERMGEIARKYLPGRVGFGPDGFANRWTGLRAVEAGDSP
jgi:hypothetical protein